MSSFSNVYKNWWQVEVGIETIKSYFKLFSELLERLNSDLNCFIFQCNCFINLRLSNHRQLEFIDQWIECKDVWLEERDLSRRVIELKYKLHSEQSGFKAPCVSQTFVKDVVRGRYRRRMRRSREIEWILPAARRFPWPPYGEDRGIDGTHASRTHTLQHTRIHLGTDKTVTNVIFNTENSKRH